MDKKIIKALYGVVAKDEVYKNMGGVHFEVDRCIATDTRILVIYHEGSEKHQGKTLSATGEPITGKKFPDVKRVIPKKLINPVELDFGQLQRACAWWGRQSEHNSEDKVVIRGTCLNINYLQKLLSFFVMTCETRVMKMYLNADNTRPVVAVSDTFTALLMPCTYTEDEVDEPRVEVTAPVVVSYENLINTYALESAKPKEKKPDAMDWL